MRYEILTLLYITLVVGIVLRSSVVESKVTGLPGGQFPIDVNEPHVKNYTSYVMERVNQHDRVKADNVYRGLVELLNATRQVVNGHRYKLTVLVGKTNCNVNDWPANVVREDNCKLVESEPRELYSAAVLNAPSRKYDGEITVEFLGVQ